MTKNQKRRWKWRCKHDITAILVCGRFLGPIPRDATTIGALDVCRVLRGDNLPMEVEALKDRLWEIWSDGEEAAGDNVPLWDGPDDGWYEHSRGVSERKYWIGFEAAWEEILRRIDYGQRVEPVIEALGRYLIYEMGGWAGMVDDVPMQFELPLGC